MTSNATANARVHYQVGMSQPHSHLYEVEAVFDSVPAGEHVLRMAAWTPGSYLVREYARHVQDLACEAAGAPLAVTKLDKAAWRVTLAAPATLRARYRVYAFELTVRTSHLDGTHGFFNGAPTFVYLDGRQAEPLTLDVLLPDDWRATTSLTPDGPQQPGRARFVARSFDELVDSPVECGRHELCGFEVADPVTGGLRPHRLAIWGRPTVDRDRLLTDVRKIVESAAALFGELPYPDYTFLLLCAPGSRGGLEHSASATLLASPFSFSGKAYVDFLELVAHEHFHAWNVKRIHPDALGPFDYTREAYTRSLWVMEGVTSYYDRLLVRRSGLEAPKSYLERIAEDVSKLLQTPGRARQSIEESSFDAWIKLYRPDENSVNSTVSYYLKGGLVTLALDLTIRVRSNGARSFDDVLRHLWARYGREGRGFRDADVQAEAEAATGVSLGDCFDKWVRGREEIDLAGALRPFGLELKAELPKDKDRDRDRDRPDKEKDKDRDKDASSDVAPAWLGAGTRTEGGRTWVSHVLDGGAAWRSGLYAGDEILALDGFRVDDKSLRDRIDERKPGEVARLTVFRRDELVEVEVKLSARPRDRISIVPRKDATPEEKARYKAWLAADFPEDRK
jgi:predicted metalloprotease with PDZ domain